MKYWITTDTHFGHKKLQEFQGRPGGVEEIIASNHYAIGDEDIMIHLGDVCISDDARWQEYFLDNLWCRKWLVKGNHDSKSDIWYLEHGWDFVANSFSIKRFGLNILFSHAPQADSGYDLNIHGHFHDNDHRSKEIEFQAIKNDKQQLVKLEHHYAPQRLKQIVEEWRKDHR